MTRPLHIANALLLSLLLVVTGQALAVARGAPLPVGQMQLCTGTGPVMVSVDATGAPVKRPHYCPEGVLSLLQAVALPALPLRVVGAAHRIPEGHAARTAPSLRRMPARARAPPLRIQTFA